MTSEHPAATELADYWTPDLSPADATRIEEHVFACADCARRLQEVAAMARGVASVVRQGRIRTFVTAAVLNRLAHDGARVRSFILAPGAVVPCAVWSDDEVIVTHMRADFTGLESVTVVMRLGTGEEIDRVSDVPVPAAAGELIHAFSAAALREAPRRQVRITLLGSRGGAAAEAVIAEYVLEHEGALDGSAPPGLSLESS